ncbi:phage tail tape measure protein [Bacillus wiedmannii]|uniref:phage tail tape measure protein n=1 Tax=Bacillus wiedmannii TaxID=1890302 RepID=UPI000BF070CC|nr:phage tail tape measure protein [Bacillus wiedmannii]PEN91869.1 phage tail tape measure protein [Bacillus wiedmannii]
MSQNRVEVQLLADISSLRSSLTQATQLWRNFQQAVSQPINIPAPNVPPPPRIPTPSPPPPPDMSGWQRTFQNVGNQAQEMGRRVQSIGQSMTTAFAPLAYASGKAFGSMIKNSMEFEQQTRKAAVLTGGAYGQVKKDILEMATSSVYSTGQVAAAYAELGAKGFDAAQSTAALPGVLSAAAASGEDLGMVADTITSALNAFSMEAKDSGHVADVLAQAANATAAGVYDMQYAFKYAAGPAAQLGIGMEELAASVGIMSNAGIKGETAGTALRSAMLRLVKPPKAAANMLKELGVTTTDSSGNMKSLSQIIGELQTGMEGMTSAQKGAALATIFGTEAVSGMMALVSAGPEKIDKLTQSLIKSDGASKKAADSMLEGWAGAIVKMQSSLDVAARAFTDALAPAISVVADVIKKLADGFNGLSPTMKTVIATVASAVAVFTVFMAVLGVFISSIGATITAFGALVGWLGKSAMVAKLASAAMVGLRAAFAFLTGPIGATIAILTLVGTALVQLYKHNETFRNAVNRAWESIKTTTISAVESMKAAFDSFGAYLATIPAKFSAMGSAIGAFFSSVIAKFNGLGQMIGGAFGSAIDGITAKFSGISSAISPVVDFIKSSFSTIGNTIATLTPLIVRLGLAFLGVSGPVGWVIAIVASLGATIFKLVNTNEQAKSALMSAWESIKGVFSTVASVIMPIITSLAQGFIDAFAPLAPEFQKTGQVIAESFATLGPALAELGAAFGELGSTIASLFGEVVKAAVPIATEMFTGFGQIMQQVMPMVTELIQMFADTTIQIMPMVSEGIQFLAQMFSEFATTVLPVFIEAFQTGFPIILQVIQTVFSIAGMLIQGFGEILSIIATTVIPIILQAVQAVFPVIAAVITAALAVVVPIIQLFGQVISIIATTVIPLILQIVQAVFPVIVSIIQAAIPVAVAIIQGLATIITGVVIPAIQFILSVVQAVFPAIMGIITSVIGIITNIIKVFTAVLQGDWSGAWNAVKGITSNVMSLIGSIIQGAISLITAVVTAGLNLVQSIFSSVLSAISSLVSSIFSGIGSVISSTMSAAGSIISAMWNAAMSATSSILNQIYNTVTQIFNNVTSFLSGINLGDIGRNMMQGLLDGISGMAGAIWDKITDIGTGIKDKFTSLLSIHSPSRVFRDYGIYTGKGYVNGVDGMKSAIIKTSENMANWMKPEMLAVDTGSVNTGMAKAVAPSVYANTSRKSSTDVASNFQREMTIENVIVMDGREIARATKGYLDNMRMQDVSIQSYLLGDKG